MAAVERIVIVGGGLAGYTLVDELRKRGYEGGIALVEPEPAAYDRPPLSKDLFADDFGMERLAFGTAETLAERGVDTRFGRGAVAIDPATGTVALDDGETITGDAIVLATGGRARTLPIPGADLPVVHVLRTLADALAIRDAVTAGTRVAIVGAGLVGAELASALRRAGAAPTVIDPVPVPLAAAVGPELAAHLHAMHAANGVPTVVGVTTAIEPADAGVDVVLDDGTRVGADLVVVGIGILPNTELAAAAGLDVDGGVLVDEAGRTSHERVWAIGDVARLRGADGVLHRRAEHWEAAQRDAQRAAAALLGEDAPEQGCEWFWSDRYGVHLEAVGRLGGPGRTIVRAGEHPTVFHVDGDLLVGAAAIDDTTTVRAARRLIDQRIPVADAELADPAVVLRGLLKRRPTA